MPDDIKVRVTGEDAGASSMLQRIEQHFGQTGQAAGRLGGQLSQLTSGFGLAGLGAVGATGAIAAMGVGLFKLGTEIDSAYDRLAIGTGRVGAALTALQADFQAVATTVPNALGQTADVMAALNARLGLTGEALQDLSRQILTFSRLTGTDAAENVRLFGRVLQDAGVPLDQYGLALDKLFRLTQASGVAAGKLQEQLVQYGAPLRQLGFSFEQAASLVAKFEAEGVNAELVLGSLRIALGEFARQGMAPKEALQEVTSAIKNTGDEAKAQALGLAVFGARAGPDMVAAIREGRFEIDRYVASMQDAGGAVEATASATDDAAERFATSANKMKVALEPVAIGMLDTATAGLDNLNTLGVGIDTFLTDLVPKAVKAAELWRKIRGDPGAGGEPAPAGPLVPGPLGGPIPGQDLFNAGGDFLTRGLGQFQDLGGKAMQAFGEGMARATLTNSDFGPVMEPVFDSLITQSEAGGEDAGEAIAEGFVTGFTAEADTITETLAKFSGDAAKALAQAAKEEEAAYKDSILGRLDALREADGAAMRAAEAQRMFNAELGHDELLRRQIASLGEQRAAMDLSTEAQREFTRQIGAGDLATQAWNTRLRSLSDTVSATMDVNAKATIDWKIAIGDTEGAIQALADATGLSMAEIRAALGATGAAFDALRARMAAGAGPATGSYAGGKGSTTGGYVGTAGVGGMGGGAATGASLGALLASGGGGGGGFGDIVGAGGSITGGLISMGDPGGNTLIRQMAYNKALKELYGINRTAIDPEWLFEQNVAAAEPEVRGTMNAIIDEMMRKQGPPQMSTGGSGAYGGGGGSGGASTSAWTSQYLTSGPGPVMASTGGRAAGGWSSPPVITVNVPMTSHPFVSPAETQRQGEEIARVAAPYVAQQLGTVMGYSLT